MNAFASDSYSLSRNSMPADAFARVVSITDNAVNRTGIINMGKRILQASTNCTLFTPDQEGRYNFARGTECVQKNFITMRLAESRGLRAIEVRNSPLFVTFPVAVSNGFDPLTGVDDDVTFSTTALTRIVDPALFVSAVGLSTEKPLISASMVGNMLADGAVHVMNDAIDEYGNITDPRCLYTLFNRSGLFVIGRPVIRDYRSSRLVKLKEQSEETEKKQAKLQAEAYNNAVELERNFILGLSKLVAELTPYLSPEEIRSTIQTMTAHRKVSSDRIRALVNEELQRTQQQYCQSIALLDPPKALIPTAQNRLVAGACQTRGLSAPDLSPGVNTHYPAALRAPGYTSAVPSYAPLEAPPVTDVKAPQDSKQTCRVCGNPFVFTEGERAFYAEHGLETPRRCPTCRKVRKALQNRHTGPVSDGTPMLRFGDPTTKSN